MPGHGGMENGMKKAELIVDKYYLTGEVDKRSSVPLWSISGGLFMKAFTRKTVLLPMNRG